MAFTLKWDETAKKMYETGSKRAVLYKQDNTGAYGSGVAWSGLTGVDESPSGADATDLWADDTKYLTLRSAEQFGFTIKAYMYPPEFGECDGTAEPATGMSIYQQPRRAFGFCYTSTVGNDVQLNDYGQKIHLIYGATASPSSRSMGTINDSPEAVEFSWECTTNPVDVPGYKATAEIVLDSTKISAEKWAALESILFGDGTSAARLPLPAELIEILEGSVADATLTDVEIANATLVPEFDDEVFVYAATTTSASGKITVTAAEGINIAIKVNGTTVENEGTASFNEGNNTVVITASKPGMNTTTTNITVVRS